jgi:predicted nucleic acid-binding protein
VSNRIFIDTLFVVALINPRDQYHAKATELAAKYESHPFLVSDAVLLEIGNGLARNYKQEAIEVIEGFFNSEEVEIVRLTPDLFERAFELYKKYEDKDWGLIDCISFIVMMDAGVTQALTFDQHFGQAGFEALMANNGI